jgi:hypothetical protein
MTTYTINYTETEDKAMQYAAASVDDWIQNAAHERARIAIEEIVKLAVEKFLEAGQSIPGSREEIVAAAFANGWVKTAAQRNEEALAAIPTV